MDSKYKTEVGRKIEGCLAIREKTRLRHPTIVRKAYGGKQGGKGTTARLRLFKGGNLVPAGHLGNRKREG